MDELTDEERREHRFSAQGCRIQEHYGFYKRKDGKRGRWEPQYWTWYSPLVRCCACDRLGGKRQVRHRYKHAALSDFDKEQYEMCMVCYRKKRALRLLLEEIREIECLISILKRCNACPHSTTGIANLTRRLANLPPLSPTS